MTVTIAPYEINLQDFLGGWCPDLDPTAIPENGLYDALNVRPDNARSNLIVRDGISVVEAPLRGMFAGFSTYTVAINPLISHYVTPELRELIVVSNAVAHGVAGNTAIYKVTTGGVSTRIDNVEQNGPNDREWLGGTERHWGLMVENTYFGGNESDPIYWYKPYYHNGVAVSSPFEPDATMPIRAYNQVDWSSAGGPTIALHTVMNDDGKTYVCIEEHTAKATNRPSTGRDSTHYWEYLNPAFDDWADATDYEVGDIVYMAVTGDNRFPRGFINEDPFNMNTEWSAFICTKAHTSDTADNAPPERTVWKPYRGPKSGVAVFHANRMFMRDSDPMASTVRYSSSVREDGTWDSTDWEADDVQGAGYFEVRPGDGERITALVPMGENLLVFKPNSIHILNGVNPESWDLNEVSVSVGCDKESGAVRVGEMVYFVSNEGLKVTDGVEVRPAPGGENFNFRLTLELAEHFVKLIEENGFIYIFRINPENDVNLAPTTPASHFMYDTKTGSLWPTDYSAVDACILDTSFSSLSAARYLRIYATHNDAVNVIDTAGQDNNVPIGWLVETGTHSFGIEREERMVRRTLAKIVAWEESQNITLAQLKHNWDDPYVSTVTNIGWDELLSYVEGKVIPSTHMVAVRLTGAGAVTLNSIYMRTIRRRSRYHRGIQS